MTPDAEAAVRAAVDALVAAVVAAVGPPADTPDRLYSIDEAAHALGIGRSRLYAEIGAGHLRTVTSGRRRLVPASAIRARIEAGRPTPASVVRTRTRGENA